MLKQICLNDQSDRVRDAAVIRLTDEADIAYVAANSTYCFTWERALKKMPDDQRVFFKAAKKYQFDAALKRLDPRGLFMLFLRYKDVDYAEKVGERLLQLSEEGYTDRMDNVDDASLQTLANSTRTLSPEYTVIQLFTQSYWKPTKAISKRQFPMKKS